MNDRLLAGLIDVYAKCGEIESARNVFNAEGSPKCTARPWNAMLSGFAIHGKSDEAVKLFERMKALNIPPDKVTFVSLLNACSHGRLVDHQRIGTKKLDRCCLTRMRRTRRLLCLYIVRN